MLDGNKLEDIKEISKYGKARGFLAARRYNLPTFSHFYVIQNEDEVQALLEKHKNQDFFCMRSDTEAGNIPLGVKGKNGDRKTIFEFIEQVKQKSRSLGANGVAIIYWNDGKFCPTYEIDGSFYLDFRTGKELLIDYIGKGWDGSFLSHASACHETYSIPWEDVLFFDANNRGRYKKQIISAQSYAELRRVRINQLHKDSGLAIEECERVVPSTYTGMNNEYLRQVINQVVLPMYASHDLQKYYSEYIPIVQIENGKVVVPEIILPERLRVKQKSDNHEER